jgi:hypothetical protein
MKNRNIAFALALIIKEKYSTPPLPTAFVPEFEHSCGTVQTPYSLLVRMIAPECQA